MSRERILERFTRDLILRGNFKPQILPIPKKLWLSMQRALLDTRPMMLLEEFTQPNFLRIREDLWVKVSS